MKKVLLVSLLVLSLATTASAFTFSSNLKLGSRGPDVKALQVILNSDPDTRIAPSGLGSKGLETTTFGPATKRAVIKFQNKYKSETLTPAGLTTGTGFVGSLTRQKLSTIGATATTPVTTVQSSKPTVLFTKSLSAGLTNDPEVKKLQTMLAQDGSLYPERTISGNYDFYTVKAVQRFQDRYNLATPEQKLTANYGAVGVKTADMLLKIFGDIQTATTTPTPTLAIAPAYSGGGGSSSPAPTPVVTTPTPVVTPPAPTPIDGGWSAYGACSVTACGQAGTQTRTCTNPTPSSGGATCAGASSQSCSTAACGVTTFAITATAGASGAISPTGATGVAQGASQTFTITPNSGYTTGTLTIDGASIATSTTYTFTNVQASHTIGTTFSLLPVAPVTYTLTASSPTSGTITPTGVTTINQGNSQTYTITPATGYSLTTLIVDGVSVTPASSYTFSNVTTNHTISAMFTLVPPPAPTSNAITLSLVPARTSGVAPLAVFFDASGTTDPTMTSRPFHDLEYTWNFGDSSAGTWSNGAQPGVSSKNTATGPVSAHVFETPGTYTVNLSAFDGVNTATTQTTITVDDPNTVFAGTNTICVSAVSDFTGCPTSALTVATSSFPGAINTYALTGKRVLFKRGDVFTGTTYGWLKVDGPGIIGAFGVGVAPVVRITISSTYNTPYLALSNNNTAGINDWRIMDLEFDGLGNTKAQGINAFGSIDQVTILRVHLHDISVGILFDAGVLDSQNSSAKDAYGNITVTNFPLARHIYDEIAIIDSILTPVRPSVDGWRIYASAKHFSIMGNTLGNVFDDTSMGYHTIRNNYAYKYVLSNNTFSKSKGLALKLHAPSWCDATSLTNQCLNNAAAGTMPTPTYSYLTNTPPVVSVMGQTGGYSEQIVISDNKIIGNSIAGDPNVSLFNVGPQNAVKDERLKDVILERNFFKAGLNTQIALTITGREITARNNICDLTGGTNGRTCIEVKPYASYSPAPFPKDVWVYNNTAYNGDVTAVSQPSFSAVSVDLGAVDVTVKNNLGYSPLSYSSLTRLLNNLSACVPSCVIESNNSTDTQVKSGPNPFGATTPSALSDFRLTAGSYGLDTGTVVKVFSDFFRNLRSQGSGYDMGAVEGL